MRQVDSTKPKDRQQLFEVADSIMRPQDLQGLSWRRGFITGVHEVEDSYNGPLYFYTIQWEDGTTDSNYLGSNLRSIPLFHEVPHDAASPAGS